MNPTAIKAVRRKHGISQEALARLLGVSFATVNRWENGKGHPRGMTLRALRAVANAKELPEDGSRLWDMQLRGTGEP